MKKNTNGENSASWIPFWRQLFICSGVWPSFYLVGLCIGSTTVLVPQIREEANSTSAVSDDMVSWLSSATHYSAVPWVFILTIASHAFGRKLTMLFIMATSLVANILFSCSSSLLHIFISEALVGVSSAAQLTISLLVLTEYVSPEYRGVFLTIKSASMFWGIWTANAIGTFWHWTNIGYVGIVCSIYAFVTIFYWPESPYWLASKKKFEECSQSHQWLKGTDKTAEDELNKLLTSQKSNQNQGFVLFFRTFVSHNLYKPLLITTIVLALYHFSGKLVCSIYAIDILKRVTLDESKAYTGMLILDGVTVFGMYFGCILSKFTRRRSQLLVACSIGIVSLFALSLYLYLVKLRLVNESAIISISLLVIFSLSICCGPIIMSTSIAGELLPLEYRNACVCLMAVLANVFMATALKFGPLVFKTFDVHGAFLFYGIVSSFLLFLTYMYLPETKDRTLQEIQDYFRGHENKDDKILKIGITKVLTHL